MTIKLSQLKIVQLGSKNKWTLVNIFFCFFLYLYQQKKLNPSNQDHSLGEMKNIQSTSARSQKLEVLINYFLLLAVNNKYLVRPYLAVLDRSHNFGLWPQPNIRLRPQVQHCYPESRYYLNDLISNFNLQPIGDGPVTNKLGRAVVQMLVSGVETEYAIQVEFVKK